MCTFLCLHISPHCARSARKAAVEWALSKPLVSTYYVLGSVLGAGLQLETGVVWLTSKRQQETCKPLKTGNTERLNNVLWETVKEGRRREALRVQGAGLFGGDCMGTGRRCGAWGGGFISGGLGSAPASRTHQLSASPGGGGHPVFSVSPVSLEVSRAGSHPSPDFGRLRCSDLFENVF